MNQDVMIEEYIDIEKIEELKHGEIKPMLKESGIRPTDEFVKMSRYLNTIFAYYNIPTQLLGISLIFAQRMEFKTNILLLFKQDKLEIGDALGLKRRFRKNGQADTNTVDKLISECKKYDIIRPTQTKGKFVVNAFLFSTGDKVETRKLQAEFDFEADKVVTGGEQHNRITGKTIRKAVANRRDRQIEGQQSLFDAQYLGQVEPAKEPKRKRRKKNQFNDFPEQNYDFDSIEKSILGE